jgi:hypothetical protein
MTRVVLYRGVAGSSAGLGVGQGLERNTTNGRQDKSAASGRAQVVGWVGFFYTSAHHACWRFRHKVQRFQVSERHRCHFPSSVKP